MRNYVPKRDLYTKASLREKMKDKNLPPIIRKEVPEIINECFKIINEELSKGNEVILGGLGTFKIKEFKKEGEEKARKIIRFIPAKKQEV